MLHQNLRRWTEHRSTSYCLARQQNALRTSSLTSYGFSATRASTPPAAECSSFNMAISSTPCPGLKAQSDHRITTYLRPSASGGGSRGRPSLSAALFHGRTWSQLSDHEKRIVSCREEHEFKWRNSRAMLAVFATNCLGSAAGHRSSP